MRRPETEGSTTEGPLPNVRTRIAYCLPSLVLHNELLARPMIPATRAVLPQSVTNSAGYGGGMSPSAQRTGMSIQKTSCFLLCRDDLLHLSNLPQPNEKGGSLRHALCDPQWQLHICLSCRYNRDMLHDPSSNFQSKPRQPHRAVQQQHIHTSLSQVYLARASFRELFLEKTFHTIFKNVRLWREEGRPPPFSPGTCCSAGSCVEDAVGSGSQYWRAKPLPSGRWCWRGGVAHAGIRAQLWARLTARPVLL